MPSSSSSFSRVLASALLLAAAPRTAVSQSAPAAVAWSTRNQPFRDNQGASPTVAFGPSGGVPLAVGWSLPFSTDPAGIFSETVSDAAATYAMTAYARFGATTVSALSPATGAVLWSTNVSHAGGFFFASAGLQLTSVGVLVTHSVAPSWQCLTALNVADGSVAWTLNTSQVFDHVTIDPSGTRILLTDYFGDGVNPMGLMFVDARSGAQTANLTTSFPCVAPIVTLDAIVCFCDGDRYATHLCGLYVDLHDVHWRAPAVDPSLGPSYFPSTSVLSWTQIGAVGYGSLVTAIVDAQNMTRLRGVSIVDGSPTDLFGPAPGVPGMSAAMPWGATQTASVFPVDITVSNAAATAFVSFYNASDVFLAAREADCDEAVRHGARGAPRWATCAAAAATAGGQRHRCVAAGDCDRAFLPAAAPAAAAAPKALRVNSAASPPRRRSVLRDLDAVAELGAREGAGEGAPLPVSRWPFVALGLGAGNSCFHAYTIQRYAGNLGVSNTVVGADGGVDPSQPQRVALYLHGAAAGGGGDQVETMAWDGAACGLASSAGITSVADNGRFLSIGGVDGLIVTSGLAFDAGGALLASMVTGVTGNPHPTFSPTPSPSPSTLPSPAAAAAPATVTTPAGPVVGGIVGLLAVSALGLFAWRQRDALSAMLGGGRRRPIVHDDDLLASAYESSGSAGGGASFGMTSFGVGKRGGAGGAGGGDLYASL
jgi:hypothetical protein